MTSAAEERLDEITDPRPLQVDILMLAWGAQAVEQALTLCIAALLSPRNLPAAAAGWETTIVFLSREADREQIEDHPIAKRVAAYAKLVVIPIDDLLAAGKDGNYGLTITFAVARGILRRGDQMVKTYFIIMAADFILADGALTSLAEEMAHGRSAVFAPSWRAGAEEVGPLLETWREGDGIMAIPPRPLAELALQHLHPTVLAGLRNLGQLDTSHHNQFYWSVDERTLISRQLLMHLFCIRPETVLDGIDYFFDYGLFETACPTQDHVVLADSDQFMALELQGRNSERDRLQVGLERMEDIVADIQSWTTSVHRKLGTYTCVLHSGDARDKVGVVTRQAASFMDGLFGQLGAPLSPRNHPYWGGALAFWARKRKSAGATIDLSEFRLRAPDTAAPRAPLFNLPFGRWIHQTRFHPRWAETDALRRFASAAGKDRPSAILFGPAQTDLVSFMPPGTRLADGVARLKEFAPPPVGLIAFELESNELPSLTRILCETKPYLDEDGQILVAVREGNSNLIGIDVVDMAISLTKALQENNLCCLERVVVGGMALSVANYLLKFYTRTSHDMDVDRKTGRLAPIARLFLGGLMGCVSLIGNFRYRRDSHKIPARQGTQLVLFRLASRKYAER